MDVFERAMIFYAVPVIVGVMLVICCFVCLRRRRDRNDSDSEASNPEVFKPPPTYEEVIGSNNFPVRQDGTASNGYTMNVATVGNVQMQVQQPPPYDSLSAATTGLSAQPETQTNLENTPSYPPNPADNQTETPAEPSVAETPEPAETAEPASSAQDPPDGICAVTMPPSCSDQVPLAEQEQGSALPV